MWSVSLAMPVSYYGERGQLAGVDRFLDLSELHRHLAPH